MNEKRSVQRSYDTEAVGFGPCEELIDCRQVGPAGVIVADSAEEEFFGSEDGRLPSPVDDIGQSRFAGTRGNQARTVDRDQIAAPCFRSGRPPPRSKKRRVPNGSIIARSPRSAKRPSRRISL